MNPNAKRKNKILKAVTVLAVIVALISAMCVDSESWIPTVILGISVGWLALFTIANVPYK